MDVAGILGGRFEVLSEIAHGGMSDVVEARDLPTGELVAIKLLRESLANDPEAVLRFEREARVASTLKSRHAVRILDCGVTEGGHRPFIVTELLHGQDLARELSQRMVLPVEEAATFIAQACHAMIEAHDAGITHRDLKPTNLFIAEEGGKRVLKVLDFGLAGMTPHPEDERLTMTRSLFGSPLYMSPESFRSAKVADARSDVWSLGVVLYECLTGTAPFHGENALAVGLAVTRETYRIPSERRPDLPHAIDVIIARALKKDPKDRYQSMRELMAAIEVFLPRGRNETLELRRIVDESSDDQATQRVPPAFAPARAPMRGQLVSDPDSSDAPTRVAPDVSELITRIANSDSREVVTRIPAPADSSEAVTLVAPDARQQPVITIAEQGDDPDRFEPVPRTLIVEPQRQQPLAKTRPVLPSHTEVIPPPRTEPTGDAGLNPTSDSLEFDLEKHAPELAEEAALVAPSSPPTPGPRRMLSSLPPFREETYDGPSLPSGPPPSEAPPPPKNRVSLVVKLIPVGVVLGLLGWWVVSLASAQRAPSSNALATSAGSSTSATATSAPGASEPAATASVLAAASETTPTATASATSVETAASAASPPAMSSEIAPSASVAAAPTTSTKARVAKPRPHGDRSTQATPAGPPTSGGAYQPPGI